MLQRDATVTSSAVCQCTTRERNPQLAGCKGFRDLAGTGLAELRG